MPSDSGRHKGSREQNFWKRKSSITDQVEEFKGNNQTLFQESSLFTPRAAMPEVEDIQEVDLVASDQEDPLMDNSSAFSISQSVEETKPSRVTPRDILVHKLSPSDKPNYNEAQKAKLRKQARIAAVAQGIQGIAGVFGLAGGYDVPNTSSSPLGADAINRMGQMDEQYFKELAQYRDAELKANTYNANAANDAEMAKFKDRQEAIRTKTKYDFAADESEKDREFKRDQSNKDRSLKRRGYAIDQQRVNNYGGQQRLEAIKRYEAEYDDLGAEYQTAIKNFDDAKAAEVYSKMTENMDVRRILQSQLAEREGFNLPEDEPAQKPAAPRDWGQAVFNAGAFPSQQRRQPTQSQPSNNDMVEVRGKKVSKQEVNMAVEGVIQRATISPEPTYTKAQLSTLVEAVMDAAVANGKNYSEKQAKYIAKAMMSEAGKSLVSEKSTGRTYQGRGE